MASAASEARLLIVGAGLTGGVVFNSLRAAGFAGQISVYEKARGFGGRMSVARGKDGQVADLGAQYVTPKVPAHETYVNELLQRGVLVPFDGIIEGASSAMVSPNDMVAPQGMSSIVKHFYTGAKPAFQERVASIELLHLHSTQAAAAGSHDTERSPPSSATDRGNRGDHDVWKVTTESGREETFDAVVITVPVPQLLALKGDIQPLLDPHRTALEAVTYSSRYGIAMFFDREHQSFFDAIPWTSQYVGTQPFVRYVSKETSKRSVSASSPSVNADGADGRAAAPSLLVHTTVKVWDDALSDADIEAKIRKGLSEVIPGLPEPESVKVIKWRYSQVFNGYEGKPGALLLSGAGQPPMLVAGDAFATTGSNFDGCIESGRAAASLLLTEFAPGSKI